MRQPLKNIMSNQTKKEKTTQHLYFFHVGRGGNFIMQDLKNI